LEAVVQANQSSGSNKHLIAGTGTVSTQETIDLTRAAANLVSIKN
jgi:dihydrodipicolinate synthase/N-acetylneuraminate lyase